MELVKMGDYFEKPDEKQHRYIEMVNRG